MGSVLSCETQNWPAWTTLTYSHFLTPWLLEQSEGAEDPADPGLCKVCRRLDFRWLTQNPLTTNMALVLGSPGAPAPIDLGSWKRIKSNKETCAFCRLVHHTIKTQFPDPAKNPMGEVKRCGLLNESRERADGYVIKILPSYKHDLWNPRDFEQAKMALRFLDTGIQPMKEQGAAVGGRMVGDRANVSLARSWLKQCPKCHGEDIDARTRVDLDPPSILRLIDVHRGCLTHFSTAAKEVIPEYAALSYVWGDTKQPRTTKTEKASLEVAGSLRDPSVQRVSRTVSDAIELAKDIGIPYLWVDAICIIQDDPKELANQIQAMGWIYQSATITIVAATGPSADAGLPGIANCRRSSKQSIESIQGAHYVNMLPMVQNVIDELSIWTTRAWTYQEKVFSKRLLVVTDRQMYLKCEHNTFCEDITLENTSCNVPLDESQRSFYHDGNEDNYYLYLTFATAFSQRSISDANDIPNAFAGISNLLAIRFRSPLCHGIPMTALDILLLWRHDDGSLRRTITRNGRTSPRYPSWSWFGWTGKIIYDGTYPFENNLPRMAWEEGSPSELHRSLRSAEEANQLDQWHGWKHWTRRNEDQQFGKTYYIEEDHPGVRFNWPILPVLPSQVESMQQAAQLHWLCFWTRSAHFKLKQDEIARALDVKNYVSDVLCYMQPYDLKVYSRAGQLVGKVSVSRSVALRLQFEGAYELEFIVLTRTTLSENIQDADYIRDVQSPVDEEQDHEDAQLGKINDRSEDQNASQGFGDGNWNSRIPWPLYNVMMVERIGRNDATYRLGVGKIHITAFWEEKPVIRRVALG